MYKALKAEREPASAPAELAHDRAVTEATATGSPMRIDDETLGIPLVSTAPGAFAGRADQPARLLHLQERLHAWSTRSTTGSAPTCAALSHAKRDQRTDLTGERALLTGGRAKIGMYIALRLLRDGAHTTITTRFPHDAVRRFSALRGQRRLDRTGSRSSASTCATRPRWSRWPTTSPPPGRSTS